MKKQRDFDCHIFKYENVIRELLARSLKEKKKIIMLKMKIVIQDCTFLMDISQCTREL